MKRAPRWVVVSGIVLAIAVGGVSYLLLGLETALRGPVNNYLRDRTLALLHEQSPEGLVISLPTLDLSLIRRRLVLKDVRIRYDRKDGSRYVRFEATAPTIILTGLDLDDIIWQQNLRLNGVRIVSPRVNRVEELPADSTARPAPVEAEGPEDTIKVILPPADSLLYELVASWLPDQLRGGRIEEVVVANAGVVSTVRHGKRITTDSTADLTLTMRGIQLDSARYRVFESGDLTVAAMVHATPGYGDSVLVERARVQVAPTDTTFSIGQFRTGPADAGHALRLVRVLRSQVARTLTVDSALYAPAHDAAFFRQAQGRATRVRALATDIRVRDLKQSDLRTGRVTPASIHIGALDVHVLSDLRPPKETPRRHTPGPARFATLGWVAGADTVVVESGQIEYTELRPGRAEPAVVTFDSLKATITNATNDTARAGPGHPLVMDARALVMGEGALRAHVSVLVMPGPLNAQVEGRLGPMALASLNRFMLSASGARISSGQLTEATFAFSVRRGAASGRFSARYDGLKVEMVDRITHKQNLGQKLKSMVANMLVRDSNQPDRKRGLRDAPIEYAVVPSDTFWGVMWRSVKSGMVKLVKQSDVSRKREGRAQ